MGLMINPAPTFTLNNGDIASNGLLYFYENGSTTTEKDIFTNPSLTTRANNPLPLTDAGRLPTCFGNGTYTIVFKSSSGVQQWVRNDVAIDDLQGQFSNYSAVKIYRVNEIVRYTDGQYYYSNANENRGNTPGVNSKWWTRIAFLEFFNTSKADNDEYMEDDIVILNGYLYRSLEDDNGDTPPSAKWANLTFNDSIAGDFDVSGEVTANSVAATTGMTFGNSSQAGATILDWYQEGTFLPNFVGATSDGVATYTTRSGRWTRIGNRVDVYFVGAWSSHTGIGAMKVDNLPFTSNATNLSTGVIYSTDVNFGSGTFGVSSIGSATSTVLFYGIDPTGAANPNPVPLPSACVVCATSLTYFV